MATKEKAPPPPKRKRGRLKKGEERPKVLKRLALWLGHERLETTHHYVEADLQLKERALRRLDPLGQSTRRFKAYNERLLSPDLPGEPLIMESAGHDLDLGRRRASPAPLVIMRSWS